MNQTVLLFARAGELAGSDRVEIELPTGSRVGDLRVKLLEALPALRVFTGALFIAVNSSYAGDDMEIPEGAEIACFPPVSGG